MENLQNLRHRIFHRNGGTKDANSNKPPLENGKDVESLKRNSDAKDLLKKLGEKLGHVEKESNAGTTGTSDTEGYLSGVDGEVLRSKRRGSKVANIAKKIESNERRSALRKRQEQQKARTSKEKKASTRRKTDASVESATTDYNSSIGFTTDVDTVSEAGSARLVETKEAKKPILLEPSYAAKPSKPRRLSNDDLEEIKLNTLRGNLNAIEHKIEREENELLQMIEEALVSEKTAPYNRTKLMVVGEGRAGKTSTIKSLLNQAFDEKEASTKGFDLKRVDAADWMEDSKSYLAEHLQQTIDKERQRRNSGGQGQIERPFSDASSVFSQDSEAKSQAKNFTRNSKTNVERSNPIIDPWKKLTAAVTKGLARQKNESEQKVKKAEITKEEIKRYKDTLMMSGTRDQEPLSFAIWDFGGQKVFYTLHHLFLTEYGLYLLVFNMQRLLDEKLQEDTIGYLKFWLYSKKLYAPNAPILLVGTRGDALSKEEIDVVNRLLMARVLGYEKFNEYRNEQLTFFPIDNLSKKGIAELRKKIETVVKEQTYIHDEIPVSYIRALELLLEKNEDYILMNNVQEIREKCGLSAEMFSKALQFLNQRGLVTYFPHPRVLSRFIILQPQWLIDGITDIIFDENEHNIPIFSEALNNHFRRFIDSRVISLELLQDIWNNKGYSKEVQTFFLNVMVETSLMCDYKFDNFESFIIPTLFCNEHNAMKILSKKQLMITEAQNYNGPYFVLDFSGDYDIDIVNDSGGNYVRYLPFGIFERLICLCVQHSSRFDESIKPEIKQSCAKMSFGIDVDFQLKACTNDNDENLWIKVATEDATSFKAARELVKTIYSMIDGLKADYFTNTSSVSTLSISLLLPSSDNILAEYNRIIKKRKVAIKQNRSVKFRPSKVSRRKVLAADFDHWFSDSVQNDYDVLTDPNRQFMHLYNKDPKLTSFASPAVAQYDLDSDTGLIYHCFLSYKQSSAVDLVGKLYFILTSRGYKCWYDQQLDDQITLEAMTDGIEKSMVYILILSKDIFTSSYVVHEVETAVRLNKPIIFLHHPSTGEAGYCEFYDYVNSAPEVLKPYFQKVESIQLQRRHYLEQAVTELLDQRLQKNLPTTIM